MKFWERGGLRRYKGVALSAVVGRDSRCWNEVEKTEFASLSLGLWESDHENICGDLLIQAVEGKKETGFPIKKQFCGLSVPVFMLTEKFLVI